MTDELRTEVEQVKERQDVKEALKQTSSIKPAEKPKAETKDKLWLGTHVIVLLALAALRFLLQFNLFGVVAQYTNAIQFAQRTILGAIGVVLLLAVAGQGDRQVGHRRHAPDSPPAIADQP